jgi:hypothetical protein
MHPTTPPTQAEIDHPLVQLLPRGVSYGVTGVMHTQFSIARHYGGINWSGHHFTYFPEGDQLWRDDVLQAVAKLRKLKAEDAQAEPATEQGELL